MHEHTLSAYPSQWKEYQATCFPLSSSQFGTDCEFCTPDERAKLAIGGNTSAPAARLHCHRFTYSDSHLGKLQLFFESRTERDSKKTTGFSAIENR
jgi:hypothetical protein